MSDLQRVGTIYHYVGAAPQPCDTEPHTNNSEGGYLDKCDVCGDTHWIGTPGQCGKG
jgi:hypothetical protein